MDFGSMIGTWQKALTEPEKTFAAESKKDKVTWMAGLTNFGIAYAVTALATGAYTMVSTPKALGMVAGVSLATIPITFVIGLIVSVAMAFLFNIMAGLLGGKGKPEKTYYVWSLFGAPLGILGLVSLIPCVGWLVGLLLAIYQLYLLTLCMKALYGFDTLKAVATWIVPYGVLVVIVFVAAALFAASVMGAMGFGALSALA